MRKHTNFDHELGTTHGHFNRNEVVKHKIEKRNNLIIGIAVGVMIVLCALIFVAGVVMNS